jgi:hypothetical protein
MSHNYPNLPLLASRRQMQERRESPKQQMTTADAVSIELREATMRTDRGGNPVVWFSVVVCLNDIEFLEIPDWRLIRGRIQGPSQPKRTAEGLMFRKTVRPSDSLLNRIHLCIQKTDWFTRWPSLPKLLPIVPRAGSFPEDEIDY